MKINYFPLNLNTRTRIIVKAELLKNLIRLIIHFDYQEYFGSFNVLYIYFKLEENILRVFLIIEQFPA